MDLQLCINQHITITKEKHLFILVFIINIYKSNYLSNKNGYFAFLI